MLYSHSNALREVISFKKRGSKIYFQGYNYVDINLYEGDSVKIFLRSIVKGREASESEKNGYGFKVLTHFFCARQCELRLLCSSLLFFLFCSSQSTNNRQSTTDNKHHTIRKVSFPLLAVSLLFLLIFLH